MQVIMSKYLRKHTDKVGFCPDKMIEYSLDFFSFLLKRNFLFFRIIFWSEREHRKRKVMAKSLNFRRHLIIIFILARSCYYQVAPPIIKTYLFPWRIIFSHQRMWNVQVANSHWHLSISRTLFLQCPRVVLICEQRGHLYNITEGWDWWYFPSQRIYIFVIIVIGISIEIIKQKK
jgi:hypothetical protein